MRLNCIPVAEMRRHLNKEDIPNYHVIARIQLPNDGRKISTPVIVTGSFVPVIIRRRNGIETRLS
jgi:hypothetical protein